MSLDFINLPPPQRSGTRAIRHNLRENTQSLPMRTGRGDRQKSSFRRVTCLV